MATATATVPAVPTIPTAASVSAERDTAAPRSSCGNSSNVARRRGSRSAPVQQKGSHDRAKQSWDCEENRHRAFGHEHGCGASEEDRQGTILARAHGRKPRAECREKGTHPDED